MCLYPKPSLISNVMITAEMGVNSRCQISNRNHLYIQLLLELQSRKKFQFQQSPKLKLPKNLPQNRSNRMNGGESSFQRTSRPATTRGAPTPARVFPGREGKTKATTWVTVIAWHRAEWVVVERKMWVEKSLHQRKRGKLRELSMRALALANFCKWRKWLRKWRKMSTYSTKFTRSQVKCSKCK